MTKKLLCLKVFSVNKKQHKKQILVWPTFGLMISTSKNDTNLDYVLYIQYLVYFWKNNNYIELLIDYTSKVNAITSVQALKIGF